MTDIFDIKNIKPMLIEEVRDAFDSKDFIYEFKLDGERCIAYLDPSYKTELRNKRNRIILPMVPELADINKQVKCRCVLDGELIVIKDGKPDFSEIQRRSITGNAFKIKLMAEKFPASYIAFDILYYDDHEVTNLNLIERKKLLESVVIENNKMQVSKYIEKQGIKLFDLSKKYDLEGIVAKRKDSKYFFDIRTKDWIKIKNLLDDDFVICGYIKNKNNVVSILLGQYLNDTLTFMGHVILGINTRDYNIISKTKVLNQCPFIEVPVGHQNAIWITLKNVCTVKFLQRTQSGALRQPVYKSLRLDKSPSDCIYIPIK
ncbi:MAG: DNA ligase [Clostridia bacterium]